MKISITNFRCFKGKTSVFTFEDGKVTLLKGYSGAGKSTLLESIRWCLFGNVRSIYPSGFIPSSGSGPKTSVIVEINNLKISRTQAPEQTRVEILDLKQILSQDVAQEYIDSIFGNKNVWLSSSYIRQNERCPLMASSNADRMTLLNEILFGNDNATGFENPEYYIEIIDNELAKTDTEITSKTAIFNTYYTKYVDSISQFKNVYGWTEMSTETISKFDNSIELVKNNISTLSSKLLEVSKLETRKKILLEKLTSNKFISLLSSPLLISEKSIEDKKKEFLSTETSLLALKKKLQDAVSNQTRYSGLMIELNQNKELLSKISLSTNLSEEDLYKQIATLRSELSSTQSAENSLLQLTRQLDTMEQEFKQVEASLLSYELRDVDMLKKILINSNIYLLIQDLHAKMQEACNTVDLNTFSSEDEIPILREDYSRQKHQIIFIENICKKYNISVNDIISNVDTSKQKIKFYEEQKLNLEKYNLYNTLASQRDKLTSQLITIPNELTENGIECQIKDLEARLGMPLMCPSCQCTLEMKHNKLVTATNIIDKDEGVRQIEELKKVKGDIAFNRNINQQLLNLNAKISLIDFDKDIILLPVLSVTEVKKLKDLVEECQNINVIPKYSSLEIEKKLAVLVKMEDYYQYSCKYSYNVQLCNKDIPIKTGAEDIHKLKVSIENIPILETNYSKLNDSINYTKDKIKSLEVKSSSKEIQLLLTSHEKEYGLISNYNTLNKKITSLDNELSKIELHKTEEMKLDINNLENKLITLRDIIILDEKILEDKKEYDLIKSQYDSITIDTSEAEIKKSIEKSLQLQEETLLKRTVAVTMLSLIDSKAELETIQAELIKLTTYKSSLSGMKNLVNDVTNSALQDLVDNINNTTNSILEELFDDSLVIELKLYKEMKVKQKVKPQVNITVFYNGASYDNISILSGGESSRLSLAMTLALSVIHTSPIIFLDECMSALNADLREECVEVMKKYLLPGKTVLNVEHQAVEGIYCDCVSVNYKDTN